MQFSEPKKHGKRIQKEKHTLQENYISHNEQDPQFIKNKYNVSDINLKEKGNFYHDYQSGQKFRNKLENIQRNKKQFLSQNLSLDVKDINAQIRYSFKSKRITDPQIPQYKFKYDYSNISKNPIAYGFLQQEKGYLNFEIQPQKNKINYNHLHNNLNVKDINYYQKYTYQSKRNTDPMQPNYQYINKGYSQQNQLPQIQQANDMDVKSISSQNSINKQNNKRVFQAQKQASYNIITGI